MLLTVLVVDVENPYVAAVVGELFDPVVVALVGLEKTLVVIPVKTFCEAKCNVEKLHKSGLCHLFRESAFMDFLV